VAVVYCIKAFHVSVNPTELDLSNLANDVAQNTSDIATNAADIAEFSAFKEFESTPQARVANAGITVAHGLGTFPKGIQLWYECVADDHGWSVGERIMAGTVITENGPSWMHHTVTADETNITAYVSRSAYITAFSRAQNDDDVLTTDSWQLVIKAWA